MQRGEPEPRMWNQTREGVGILADDQNGAAGGGPETIRFPLAKAHEERSGRSWKIELKPDFLCESGPSALKEYAMSFIIQLQPSRAWLIRFVSLPTTSSLRFRTEISYQSLRTLKKARHHRLQESSSRGRNSSWEVAARSGRAGLVG